VQKIKVMVANQPRLMRELLMATISDQPDIEIVAVLEDDAAILQMVERERPEFLVIALNQSDERPHICDVLLERFPRLRVLALAAERNSSICYWARLDLRSNRIENSEQGILNALRSGIPIARPPETECSSTTD
jgi:chemotaxis response regulator CheB